MKWVLLAFGGMCGTFGRYLVSLWVHSRAGSAFPYGTLVVNMSGALMIGFLAALADRRSLLTPELRLFLITGFLGAFTTFSALVYESWQLAEAGRFFFAVSNMAGSLILGIAAFFAGVLLAGLV